MTEKELEKIAKELRKKIKKRAKSKYEEIDSKDGQRSI